MILQCSQNVEKLGIKSVFLGVSGAILISGGVYPMPSPNLRKMVVGFLVVALLIGSSVFGLSIYDADRSGSAIERSAEGKSAFAEKLPQGLVDPDWEAANAANRINATNQVAELIAKAVIAENPEGPFMDENEPSIILPKETDLIIDEYFTANPPPESLIKKNLDLTKLKFVKDLPENYNKYFLALAAFNETVDPAPLDSAAEADAEWVAASNEKLDEHFRKLAAMPVPISLYQLHKSILELYAPLDAYSELLKEDPLAAAALTVNLGEIVSLKVAEVEMQSKKATALLPHATPAERASVLSVLRLVNIAHAQFVPVADPTHTAVSSAHKGLSWKDILEKAAIGYVKNTLLREITRQVVKWALGEGTPQFVTNWRGFLEDSVQQGIGEIIESVAPALCGSASTIGAWTGLGNIADLIDQIMSPGQIGVPASRTACTLDRVVQNIEDFGQDLRNGGWLGYSALLEPQNTLFGSIVTIADMQLRKANEKKEAAINKAVSGGGYTGTEVCDNGQKPKVIAKTRSITSLDGGVQTKEGPPLLQCEDNSEPRVTTPGVNTAGVVTKSFDAAYDRLVSANDYTALLSFLADAYISKLITAGAKGIAGASGSTGKGTPVVPGTTDAERAQQLLDVKKVTLAEARRTQDVLAQALQALQQTVSTCTANEAVVTQASGFIAAVTTVQNELALAISTLRKAVTDLEAIVSSKNYSGLAAFGTVSAAVQERDDMFQKGESADQVFLEAQNMYGSCSGSALTSNPPPPTTPPPPPPDGGEGGGTP